jgi:predicted nucleic acid-binding protein
MNTILVDTTIRVDFFCEKIKSKQADVLQQLIEEENNICICPIIYQEVLQGIRDDRTFSLLTALRRLLPWRQL